MRNFFVKFYKNIMLFYLIATIGLSYHLFVGSIPNEICVKKGENITIKGTLPMKIKTGYNNMENEKSKMVTANVPDAEEVRAVCYLFGRIPVKEMKVHVVEDQNVYASGRLVGIYEQTAGVLVLKTTAMKDQNGVSIAPAEGKVQAGDYITECNGRTLHSKEELVECIAQNGGRKVVLTLLRKGKKETAEITPVETGDHSFFLGLWVKDDMAGIGTLTYYKEDGSFGALGHGIGDGETGGLLSVEDGRIYTMTLTGIQKGRVGTPGALEGMICYGKDYSLGRVHSNSNIGIYGRLKQETLHNFEKNDQAYPVAFKQEITTGKAKILSQVSGKPEFYEIKITDISYESKDENKGIRFQVTDPRLKSLTGGIVQGMSGSPILQDGRIIGAVTHVLVSSPEKGYGVFVENMMEEM